MESKRRPRKVILIGIGFVTVASLLAGAAPVLGYRIDWAGVTMLGALAIAMSMLAYVLIVGSSGE